jgi:hypothetical protein
MAIIPTQQDYDMLQQSTRDLQVKIELLNFNLQTVDTIEGNVIDGSVNIDANQDIRRTCNISLVVTDSSFNIGEGGKIWLDKYIRINIGYTNILTKELKFWNLGLFMINNPTRTYNANTNTLSFEGLDLMAKLTGKRNGQLEALITLIPAGTPIKEAVISVITQLGGFSNYVIDDTDNVVPYDIKVETSSYVYDILSQLRDLYSNWEMFFDTDGVFNFKKIPDGVNNPVVLDLGQLETQINISDNLDVNFENVKNYIIVYGRLLDNGTQVKSQIGDYFTDSPYNVSKLGKIRYIVEDEKIYTNELAAERAYYELYLHSRMNDAINMEVVPAYWLNDVNVCVYINTSEIGVQNKYLIKSISIPLGIEGNMIISAIRVYPPEVIPKPIVTLSPNTRDTTYECTYVQGSNKLILDVYTTGEFESFNITQDDIIWTFPDGFLFDDFLIFDRFSKISNNHIRIFYINKYSTFEFPKTAQVRFSNNVAMNIYGITNNETENYNVDFKLAYSSAVPYLGTGGINTPSKLVTVGDTFDIRIYVHSDPNLYNYSLVIVDSLDASSFNYDNTKILINSVVFSGTQVILNCTGLSSGTTEVYLKQNIFQIRDQYLQLYNEFNCSSPIPYYITIASVDDLVVHMNDYFKFGNGVTGMTIITTDVDVDSFEITLDDIEYDSIYFDIDYIQKINNYTIYVYMKNFNYDRFLEDPIGCSTLRISSGVAKKNNQTSIASNISVCAGIALG